MSRADIVDFIDLVLFSCKFFGVIALALITFLAIAGSSGFAAACRREVEESIISDWVGSEGGRLVGLRSASYLELLALGCWGRESLYCAMIEVRPGEFWECGIRIGGFSGPSGHNLRVRWWREIPRNSEWPG